MTTTIGTPSASEGSNGSSHSSSCAEHSVLPNDRSVGPTLFNGNLNALIPGQPELTAEIKKLPFPSFAEEAIGRDGSRTYLIHHHEGRPSWFGQSSMPSISAPQMYATAHHLGGNVSLPGILTGVEPLVIAELIPAACAVFIFERDSWAIQLAMHLHDYRNLLSTGRLIFMPTERLRDELQFFFSRHPGYQLPAHLFSAAQRSAFEIADLQRLIESNAEVVVETQCRVVADASAALRDRSPRPFPKRPRIAVVSGDGSEMVRRLAGRVRHALASLQYPHGFCIPYTPRNIHLAAPITMIRELDPDLVLILRRGSTTFGNLLPDSLPLITWEDAPYADTVAFQRVVLTPPEQAAFECDVTIIGDLPDDRPEAHGVTLISQIALWQSLQRLTDSRLSRGKIISDELLDEAQRSCGTRLQDPKLIDRFHSWLHSIITPAALGRLLLERLTKSGLQVTLWGRNWPTAPKNVVRIRGPLPDDDTLNKVFNAARVVIIMDPSEAAGERVLDALAASARVICPDPLRQSMIDDLRFAPLLSHVRFFQFPEEAVRAVTDNWTTEYSDDERQRTRTHIDHHHSVRARLEILVDGVRGELNQYRDCYRGRGNDVASGFIPGAAPRIEGEAT